MNIQVLEQHMLPSRLCIFQGRVCIYAYLAAPQAFHQFKTFGASLKAKYAKEDSGLVTS